MSVNLPRNPLVGKKNLKLRLSKAKKEYFAKASEVFGLGRGRKFLENIAGKTDWPLTCNQSLICCSQAQMCRFPELWISGLQAVKWHKHSLLCVKWDWASGIDKPELHRVAKSPAVASLLSALALQCSRFSLKDLAHQKNVGLVWCIGGRIGKRPLSQTASFGKSTCCPHSQAGHLFFLRLISPQPNRGWPVKVSEVCLCAIVGGNSSKHR